MIATDRKPPVRAFEPQLFHAPPILAAQPLADIGESDCYSLQMNHASLRAAADSGAGFTTFWWNRGLLTSLFGIHSVIGFRCFCFEGSENRRLFQSLTSYVKGWIETLVLKNDDLYINISLKLASISIGDRDRLKVVVTINIVFFTIFG